MQNVLSKTQKLAADNLSVTCSCGSLMELHSMRTSVCKSQNLYWFQCSICGVAGDLEETPIKAKLAYESECENDSELSKSIRESLLVTWGKLLN